MGICSASGDVALLEFWALRSDVEPHDQSIHFTHSEFRIGYLFLCSGNWRNWFGMVWLLLGGSGSFSGSKWFEMVLKFQPHGFDTCPIQSMAPLFR